MRARDDRRVAMASGPFWTDLKAALRRRYGLRKVLESAAGRLIRRATFFVAVGIVLLIAVALRLLNLDRFGFNSDEAVYAGQAAALAGHQDYAQLFGVFRAHPLLVHFIVSLVYRITGVNDVAPRLVSVAFGVGMVAVGGAIGTVMRGRRVGLLTMLIIAVSAYPVMVSRQLLLDGPMAFFFALTLLFLALYVRQPRGLTLYAAACSAGLAFLAKESAILMVPAVLAFFLLARDVPLSLRDFAISAFVYLATIAAFPVSLLVGGGTRVAQEFFVWQLLRRPNHDPTFYLRAHRLPDRRGGRLFRALAGEGLPVSDPPRHTGRAARCRRAGLDHRLSHSSLEARAILAPAGDRLGRARPGGNECHSVGHWLERGHRHPCRGDRRHRQ
ncbi:MAG: glycosyltransferase family 39 protein [Chloroflexi bacterium]|nr:MAG: glycosyltransferase family 39 protein [Chloroflexota bacterium]